MNHRFYFVVSMIILIGLFSSLQSTQAADIEAGNQALGTWSCWDDGTIDPCHNFSLNSVSMSSINNGWAVGEFGAILHWDGFQWSIVSSPTSSTLNAVQMLTENDGWAVGSTGVTLHWNGSSWMSTDFPNTSSLQSVSIVTSINAWTVGGNIYHWDGEEWTLSYDHANYLRGISMVPGTNGMDGWAVGSYGTILRWIGSQWSEIIGPTDASLYDVSMISSTDGWIVGQEGTFLHWNGDSWAIVPVGTAGPLSSIWEVKASSSNDVWALGFDNGMNAIYHWDGAFWDAIEYNSDDLMYFGIGVTPNTSGMDAWAVGTNAFIARWSNSTWTPVNDPYTKHLFDVKMISPTNGWIGGTSFPISTGDLFHWNGVGWNYFMDRVDIYGMDFFADASGTMGWSVGVWGEINLWDGTTWSEVSSPSEIDLTSVDIVSRDDAWAVGLGPDPNHGYKSRGVIAHYESSQWITVTLPTTTTMVSDVSMLSSSNGFAVGRSGTILEYQGGDWQIASSPTSEHLAAVQMIDTSNGWAVGNNGTILRWDGLDWSNFTSPTSSDLRDVEFISPTDGWAVGEVGSVLHYDGISWSQVASPSRQTIEAIAYATTYELWAAGFTGFILHYEYRPILTINYSIGAPGSFFTLSGSQFPPNTEVELSINGHTLGYITSNAVGSFNFILSTALANEGYYYVTASVNPGVIVSFILDNDSPMRTQEGDYQVFDVPAGIGFTNIIHLPIIKN